MRAAHTAPLHVRLTPSMLGALTAEASAAGVNLSAATRAALVKGLSGRSFGPRRDHFLAALEERYPGAASVLTAEVPCDPSHPLNQAWTQTVSVDETGPLAQFVSKRLNLTASDLRAVISSARTRED